MHSSTLLKQAISLQSRNAPNSLLPPLIFITDDAKIANPTHVFDHFSTRLLVIIRDYHHSDRYNYVMQLGHYCKTRKTPFLVANDPILSKLTNADGIHLPEYRMADAALLKQQHPHWMITAAAHTQTSIQMANNLPIDSLLVSPVFKTTSHPEKDPIGINAFQGLIKHSLIPCYALGGLDEKNISSLLQTNAAGISGTSIFKNFLHQNSYS